MAEYTHKKINGREEIKLLSPYDEADYFYAIKKENQKTFKVYYKGIERKKLPASFTAERVTDILRKVNKEIKQIRAIH